MRKLDDERQRDLGQLADLITGALTAEEVACVRERLDGDEQFKLMAARVFAVCALFDAQPPTSSATARARLKERMAAIDRARIARG